MSESTEFLFNIKPLPVEDVCKNLGLDMWGEYGRSRVSGSKESTFNSKVTGAGFKISPWLNAEKTHVTGVLIKINNPICLIGNNAFIENMIYESARLSLLFLKMSLKSMGVKKKYRSLLSLKNAYIKKFDLTFLIKFKNIDEAVSKRDELENRIKAIFHDLDYKSRQVFGERKNRTIYLNYQNCPSMRAYVKWKDISRDNKVDYADVNNYLCPDVKKKIYAFSRSMLRIELTIRDTFLKKKFPEMLDVTSWKDKNKSDEVMQNIFFKFKEMLMIDVDLRHNKHRPADFEKLDKKVQKFLKIYYVGDEQPTMDAMTKSQRYELKKKILEKARIDISIPWEFHKTLKNINWLTMPSSIDFSSNFHNLNQYVFCRENMKIFLDKIKNIGAENAFKSKYDKDLEIDENSGLVNGSDMPYQGFGSLKIPDFCNER